MVFGESGIYGKQFRLFRIGKAKLAETVESCQRKFLCMHFFHDINHFLRSLTFSCRKKLYLQGNHY